MAVRRFVSRRGRPRQIMSDNGTNFHGSNNELKKCFAELDKEKIIDSMTTKEIEWKFIAPGSPNHGGSWERLIRSVKTALKVVLKERAPREEVLATLFAEVEYIVNGRPLTAVSLDHKDQEALTPNHILLGSSSGNPAPGIFVERDFCLRKQWRISQRLADTFWKIWLKEYLPTLAKRSKGHKKRDPPTVGDVVIIADENQPRNVWPRGLISKIYPGKDGQVRIVDVTTNHGVFIPSSYFKNMHIKFEL